MERANSNGQWSLFCPNEAPGLSDCWGDEFVNLYLKYEKEVIIFLHLIYCKITNFLYCRITFVF